MRRPESGAGTSKAIFALVVLAVVAFLGAKIIPVYVNNYELNDYISQLAIRATVGHASADAVQNDVVQKAQDLGLPVTRDNVKVSIGSKVTIDIDYNVPVDLKVYTLTLHFTPSAENRQI